MMTIIITACLIADPNVCKEHRMPIEGDMDHEGDAVDVPTEDDTSAL